MVEVVVEKVETVQNKTKTARQRNKPYVKKAGSFAEKKRKNVEKTTLFHNGVKKRV